MIVLRSLAPQGALVARAEVPSVTKPAAAQVTVDVVGLQSDRGRVLAALFRSAPGFPSQVAKAFARKVAAIADKRVRLVFDDVPPGELAIALFHDENANSSLDTNLFGMPKEGWGTSRDAAAHFGPPAYAAARLTLSAGERKRIVVHIKY
jgi:uncharacterized protein (DUF2141 family)